ncbi:hypothetical protein [Nostoc sp. CCY 9925]|uniref:hypothetical protein n=1 Tax=Nostoc sp. CCY 9925 TaxID=3103865 RepID=UPI0039C6369D
MKIVRSISNLKSIPSFLFQQIQQHWIDILITFVLAIAGGFASYLGAQLIDPVIVRVWDVWFSGDTPRVFDNMTSLSSDHQRLRVHPLFSLIAYPPVKVLEKVLHFEPITAVRIVIAVVAALWLGVLFITLRSIGCRRFDATLFSLLGATSAAAIFWFTIPETYPFGSLSILVALGFVSLTEKHLFSSLWYTAVSVLTLSITITNWMVGILVTVVNHRWKQSLQITLNTLALVTLLWAVEKYIFPSAIFFLGDTAEKEYIKIFKSAGDYLTVVKSFFCNTIVMPAIQLDVDEQYGYTVMYAQSAAPGSGSIWGFMAVGLWMALLGLGIWGCVSSKKHTKFRLVLGLSLLGQLLLHLVYGSEFTFLYSLHFLPLLIILAAFSSLTRARLVSLMLAGMLVISAGINNGWQFHQATEYFLHFLTPRGQVQSQMLRRPSDPWPRSTGHVVLATPGTREEAKAYHEPGGSFSPAVGSFGVSIWLIDAQGNLKATSDSIPLSQIQQQFVYAGSEEIPAILTKTNDYQSSWSSPSLGHWQLNLQTLTKKSKPMIVIRSVGPAGGAIQSLEWDGQRLLINERWSVKLASQPLGVYLGEEGKQGWISEQRPTNVWKGESGWGYARFELGDGEKWNLTIEDTISQPKPELNATQTKSTLELNLPNQQFSDSLNAQVAHLMMSLVNKQTRAGEPTNYPLPWLRDGAYTLVALARAGQMETAKELSIYFAEKDFFGGSGPEADAPGLSIWALEEVAVRLNDPKYDQWLWPHIHRKAEFILKMLSSKQPIHQPVIAPIIPIMKKDPELTLVAEPARNGLIIGRMDGERPLLFVNAVSYRGLLDAASLAERVNQPTDAQRWRIKAAELQKAWIKAFKPPELENRLSYTSSLWQTWIAAPHQNALLQGLQKRWREMRDRQGGFRETPIWSYLDIAEAHQWLFLGKPERVWTTLRWFWDHQTSPGLYTWGEVAGYEDYSGHWEQIRGWVDLPNPPRVTPHYWTASEMLLLQLDMLAYIDQAESKPTLVIGAGIPVKWLNQPLSVKGLSMPNGQVDWFWDGKQMDVKIRGGSINLRLGSAFPSNTRLNVEYY